MDPPCAELSEKLCDVQDALDVLQRSLKQQEISRDEYDAKMAHTITLRDKLSARIPHFWLRALISHPAIGALITGSDCARLAALEHVSCVQENEADFEVIFTFGANAYFHNRQLVKSYRNREWSGLCIGGTDIRWKHGMHPREDVAAHLSFHYGMVPHSFFDWLAAPADPRLLGTLIRDQILPDAIPLFHGSWHPNDDFFDDTDSDLSSLPDNV